MANSRTDPRITDKYVFFHQSWPSQWYKVSMVIDNINYNCCEQYMMAMKAKLFNDQDILKQIMQSTNPKEHKQFGRQVRNFKSELWNQHKYQIVYDGNYAKFTQNKKLKEKLLSFGDRIFVEASKSDKIWGIGIGLMDQNANDENNWKGQNLLGYAITKIRDKLMMETDENIHELPARQKKTRKRKQDKNDDKPEKDKVFVTVQDFISYSMQQTKTEKKLDQKKLDQKDDRSKKEALIKKIHDFGMNVKDENNETLKASEYLRKLREQHQNEDKENNSSDDNSQKPEIEDPLLTLLNIEAKDKDKPTTIEYDDRVYDKVIFQDEEFKEYRKNNLAVSDKQKSFYQNNNNNRDKIVHRKKQILHYDDGDDIEQDGYYDNNINTNNINTNKFQQKPMKKMKPNFFIALKISDVRLKRKLKNAQNLLLKELDNDSLFEQTIIDESTFHITINAIYCDGDDEIFYLINQFQKFGETMLQKLIPTKLSVRLHIKGIDHFRQKIIYGHIEDDANKSKLENVYHALHTQLQNAGIINQSHRFDPHLTIIKLSKIKNNKKLIIPMDVINKINNKYNQSLDFGYQYVNNLQLLSMIDERNKDDADDYYQVISTISPAKLR